MFVSVCPRAYALERMSWSVLSGCRVYVLDLRHGMVTTQKCWTCACSLGRYVTIPLPFTYDCKMFTLVYTYHRVHIMM